MAERLESFAFEGQGFGVSKYEKYLDGSIWRLRIPEDLPSVGNGRVYLIRIAESRGLKVRTRKDGNSLVVQAYPAYVDAEKQT
jgi:hypothetical protein